MFVCDCLRKWASFFSSPPPPPTESCIICRVYTIESCGKRTENSLPPPPWRYSCYGRYKIMFTTPYLRVCCCYTVSYIYYILLNIVIYTSNYNYIYYRFRFWDCVIMGGENNIPLLRDTIGIFSPMIVYYNKELIMANYIYNYNFRSRDDLDVSFGI